jgi:hypothetical protein
MAPGRAPDFAREFAKTLYTDKRRFDYCLAIKTKEPPLGKDGSLASDLQLPASNFHHG